MSTANIPTAPVVRACVVGVTVMTGGALVLEELFGLNW